MDKLKLIKLLEDNKANNLVAPAAKRLSSELGVTEVVMQKLVKEINSDGIYKIKTIKAGGFVIEGGLLDEKATYDFVGKNLADWIVNDIYGKHGVNFKYLKNTHTKKLSGKWSTPDFVLTCVHKFAIVPQNLLELVSIEVKHTAKQFDVTSVYEALAHTRASNYGILFFYDNPAKTVVDKDADTFEEIKVECVKAGIGLVVSQYPCELSKWNYIIPAKEHKPDLRRVEAFIEEAFDSNEKTTLRREL